MDNAINIPLQNQFKLIKIQYDLWQFFHHLNPIPLSDGELPLICLYPHDILIFVFFTGNSNPQNPRPLIKTLFYLLGKKKR